MQSIESIIFTSMKLSMNIVYTYASQIWNVGCSFLCSILAARMLGQTGQGDLALYTGFVALVTMIISVGLPSGFVHYIAARKLERQVCFPIMLWVIPIGLSLVGLFIFIFPVRSHLYIPPSGAFGRYFLRNLSIRWSASSASTTPSPRRRARSTSSSSARPCGSVLPMVMHGRARSRAACRG